jgi:hypothetical protein
VPEATCIPLESIPIRVAALPRRNRSSAEGRANYIKQNVRNFEIWNFQKFFSKQLVFSKMSAKSDRTKSIREDNGVPASFPRKISRTENSQCEGYGAG